MLIIAWLVALLVTVPSLMFVIECLLGLIARTETASPTAAPPFAVIVPAHDEVLGIAATIAAVKAQLRPCDRLLVVADNCTDSTAAVALSCGAQVMVRHDLTRLGKGYALAAGRSALRYAPPVVVIVLDADCMPQPGALALLAAAAQDGEVVQGLYLLSDDHGSGARSGISTFAFLVKNRVRQRGLRALGAPALLQGTGMAFPWPVFARAPLASGEIVEDLELGLKFALAGVPIRFFEPATVLSRASAAAGLVSQRTRWEHGSLGMARRYAPELAAAVWRGRPGLLPLLLDLLVPPLALLVMIMTVASVAATVIGLAGGGFALALWMAANLALLAGTIVAVWHRFGRAILPFGALLRVLAYLWWKIPIYARLLRHRERRWVRTGRDG